MPRKRSQLVSIRPASGPGREAAPAAVAAPFPLAPPPLASPWRRGLDRLLVALFLCALAIPGLGLALRLPGARVRPRSEPPVPLPVVALDVKALRDFGPGFHRWFSNRLGYRAWLVREHSALKLNAFHVSPSDKVILGLDGWLYLGAYNEWACVRREKPFSTSELQAWKSLLERRRDWLAAGGIKFLFVVAPDKHTIYPEHLPRGLQPNGRPSRFDQLTDYLRQHSDVVVLDLRPALLTEKPRHLLYYPVDTHWNDVGAFFAYREVCRSLHTWFPQVPLPELDAYQLSVTPGRGGDLGPMIGLSPKEVPGDWVCLVPKSPRQAEVVSANPHFLQNTDIVVNDLITERKGALLPRAVILRDSFAKALQPFLSETFSRAAFLWTNRLDEEAIARERPDVVIWEMVERDLYHPPPR